MYCKFCGNAIDENTSKCAMCGASIDFNDGGQSFFSDSELDMWKNGAENFPQTMICEPGYMQNSGLNNFEMKHSRKRKKRRKRLFKISKSNNLIIACIVSVLAVVFVVAMIAGITGLNKKDVSKTESDYVQNENKTVNVTETKKKNEQTETVIEGVKIYDMNGKQIEHSAPVYIKNDVMFVSADMLFKHMGYGVGVRDESNPDHITYRAEKYKMIELYKGKDNIRITDENGKSKDAVLAAANFNVESNTYIPIKSFLNIIGEDTANLTWDFEKKELYFKK